jgi:hypothetical protein
VYSSSPSDFNLEREEFDIEPVSAQQFFSQIFDHTVFAGLLYYVTKPTRLEQFCHEIIFCKYFWQKLHVPTRMYGQTATR